MRTLSPWCKEAKKAMVDRGLRVKDLANEIGYTKEWTSAILNGRVRSETSAEAIGKVLNISEDIPYTI